jgi:serine/threonine protein kinase
VYLAEHPSIGKRVALKVIHRELAANREVVQRFFQEAKAVNKIGHDNIVVVHDFGQTDAGDNFYIMEFIAGQTLAAVMASELILPSERAINIASQIAAGLEAAHSGGIIHRDVKPDNIMLSPALRQRDTVKILDFGLAKMFGASGPGLTAVGVMLGTPQYMSPEACQCKPNIQMVVGRRPFDAESMAAILMKQVIELPPSPAALEPDVSAGLDQIILRCLEKQPEQRFSSMSQLREALLDPVAYLATKPRMSPSRPLAPDEVQSHATLRSNLTARLTRELKESTTSILSPSAGSRSSLSPGLLSVGSSWEQNESQAAATVLLKPSVGASSYGQALAALTGATPTSGVSLPLPAPETPAVSNSNDTMLLLDGAAQRPTSSANILLTPTPSPLTAPDGVLPRPQRRWLIPGLLLGAGAIGALAAVMLSVPPPATASADAPIVLSAGMDGAIPVIAIAADAESNVQVSVGPTITTKLLRVISDPPGAQITVDGKIIGNTPLDLPVPINDHSSQLRLEMSLAGFKVEKRVVSDNATSPLRIAMIRKKAVVSTSQTPKAPPQRVRPSPRPSPPKEKEPSGLEKHDKDGLMKPDE